MVVKSEEACVLKQEHDFKDFLGNRGATAEIF
jgi:hypothetical protein